MTYSIRYKALFVCAAFLALSNASMAMAKNDKHERGGGHSHSESKKSDHHKHKRGGHDDDHHDRIVVIESRDRVHIREYLSRRHCPPGLAKKHNGCMPPGHTKRYIVGQALPTAVVYYPVPQDLLIQLNPVPVGYQYVQVDQDVLLISEASHHVIDAITLLSAVR